MTKHLGFLKIPELSVWTSTIWSLAKKKRKKKINLPISFTPAAQNWYSEHVASSVTFHSHLSHMVSSECRRKCQPFLQGEFLKYQNIPSLLHPSVPLRIGIMFTFQQNWKGKTYWWRIFLITNVITHHVSWKRKRATGRQFGPGV